MAFVRLKDLSEEERKRIVEGYEQRKQANTQARQQAQQDAVNQFNDLVSREGSYNTNKHTFRPTDIKRNSSTDYWNTFKKSNNMTLWDSVKKTANELGRNTQNTWLGVKSGFQNLGQALDTAFYNSQKSRFNFGFESKEYLEKNPEEAEKLKKLSPEKYNQVMNGVNINENSSFVDKLLASTNSVNIENEKQKEIKKRQEKKAEYQEKINQNIEAIDNPILKKTAELAPDVGNMIPMMIPGVGAIYATGSAKGAYYDDAIQRGMNDEQANTYSGIMSLMEGATEMIGVENIKKGGQAVKAFIKGTGKEVAKEGVEQVGKASIKTALKHYGIGIADNVLQESIIEPIQEVATTITGGKDKADFSNMGQRMLKAGIDGGLVSAIMGGADLGIESCVAIKEKVSNGQTPTQTEMQTAVKDAGKKINLEQQIIESTQQQVNKYKQNPNIENNNQIVNNLQKNVPQNIGNMPLNNQVQQTTQQIQKVVQNGDMRQINTNAQNQQQNIMQQRVDNLKQQAERELTGSDKADILNFLNNTQNIDQSSIEAITNSINGVRQNTLNTDETYKTGRQQKYVGYMKKTGEYDATSLQQAKELVPANNQGRRTKEQWLQIAEQIGNNIANKSSQEIEEIAYRTWQEERPASKESLNRQGKKYVQFTSDDWINTIYNTVKKIDNQQQENFNQRINQIQSQPQQIQQESTQTNQQTENTQTSNNSMSNFMQSAQRNNIDTNNETVRAVEQALNERGIEGSFNADLFTDNNQNAIWKASTDKDGNTKREVVFNPNGNSEKTMQNITVHELIHDMEGTKEYDTFKNLILDYNKNTEGYTEARKALENTYSKVYDPQSEDFSSLVDQEEVADILGNKLGDQEFVNSLVKQDKTVMQKIYDWVVDKLNKINKLTGYKSEKIFWADVKNKFDNAFSQEYQGNNNGTRYSIQTDNNGNRYVRVDTDQDIFEGINKKDYNKIAKMYIQDYLEGKTKLAENDTVKIANKGISKYTNPKQQTRYMNEKMQLSTELKNVLEVAEKVNSALPTKDTSKFPNWEYYKVNFEIGGKNFEGLINIGIDKNRNKHFYEINKIHTTSNSHVSTSKSSSTDFINNSILPTKKDVNRNTQKYSMQESEKNSGSFNLKEKQLEIIQKNNPMVDDYHTGIRTINDIKTFEEALQDEEAEDWREVNFTPDYTSDMIKEALDTGKITIYSSYPIEQGVFVTPSKMEAQSYAGNNKIYSKEVSLDEVAWIDGIEGQYAKVENSDIRYSKNNETWQEYLNKNYKNSGNGETIQQIKLPTKQNVETIKSNIQQESPNVPISKKNQVANKLKVMKENIGIKNDVITQKVEPISEKKQSERVAQILSKSPEKVKESDRKFAIFKANVLDKGIVFEELSHKTKNRELQGKWDYVLSANARGQYAIVNARQEFDSKTKKQTQVCKALEDIRTEVGENVGEFSNYMYHQLNIDRMTLEERFNGDTGINYERPYEVKNKPVFGDTVTAEISRAEVNRIEKAHPEFKEYAQDVYDYLNANKAELVKNGVISQEQSDRMADMYPHYVPIGRVNNKGNAINVPLDTGRTGVNSPIKRATGGSTDILPLFDTIAQRTLQTYRASARNNFGLELKNTLNTVIDTKQESVDNIVDTMGQTIDEQGLLQEGKNGNNPTFTVFENGERVTYEITKDMYDALKTVGDSSILGKTFLPMNKVSNFRRGVLTEYNPIFMITNPIKDVQDVLVNSQHSAKTYSKFPEAVAQITKKGYWYQEYMQNGGEQGSYFNANDNIFESDVKKSKAKNVLKMPLETISKLNNGIEMTPRLAEYIASREKGRSIETSMLDAARVTTNFKAGGDLTKFANRNGATFLNASVQGMMQQIRNITEANTKGLKGYAVLAMKYAVAGIPALLLNNLLWKDDDDYEDLQDYVKDNYYCVAKFEDGKFVRIPKGRMLSTIQTIVSNASEYITKDKKINIDNLASDFWKDIKSVMDNVAPNNPLDNNVFSPIIQAVTNKSWYGEDIVPSRLQDKPKAEQYDETTDSLSKWLGEKLNVSPYKINYLLDQYGGGISDVALPLMTKQAENDPFSDKFTTDSVMKSKYPGNFFEKVDELKVNANGSNATDEDKLKYKYVSSLQGELSDLYKQKRDIQNSDITDKEKKSKLKEVQKQINKIAEDGLSELEEINTTDTTAKIGNKQFYKVTNVQSGEKEWKELSDEDTEKMKNISLKTYSDFNEKIVQETRKQRSNGEIKEDGQLKDKDKIQLILDSNYSDNEKSALYKEYINSNDDIYNNLLSKDKININEYLKYKLQEFESDKEDDGTLSGKSIR